MNALTQTQTGGALANPSANPFASYGEQASASKEFLKFEKGEWTIGADGGDVPLGTRFVANMNGLQIGWQRWWSKKPDREILGFVAEGYQPPKRHELGDDDREMWERDERTGVPRDPWQFTNVLPLKSPDGEVDAVFSTSSRGGIGAIGQLCKEYGKLFMQKPGMLPVIEVGADSYKHPDYGKVFVPVLKLADWVDEADAAAASEPEPAPAPASKKTRF